MGWLDKNLKGGRQGDSERLEDGTDTQEPGEICPLTGTGSCPSDPDATANCPAC